MNEKKKRSAASGLHKTALAALFTVGNTLIRFPWRNADADMILLFLLSAVCALIPAFLLCPFFRFLFRKPLGRSRSRYAAAAAVAVAVSAYAFLCAYRAVGDYVRFALERILPEGPRALLVALLLLVAVWLASIPDRGIDGFSLLCFCAVVLSVVLLFAFGLPQFRTESFSISIPKNPSEIAPALPVLWKESFLPLTVLAVYYALVTPEKGERPLAVGTLAGSAILLLCVLQTLFTFGAAYAATLSYPYSFAVRVVSVGQYFFRLEGLSYFLDYTACLLRAAISLACVRRLFARFFPGTGKRIPAILGCFLFFLLLFS